MEKVIQVDLVYPRVNGNPETIEVNLEDVRASDGLRIKYDFDRDGWAIYQPRFYYVEVEPKVFHEKEEWIEAAFLQAWQFELETDEEKENYRPERSEMNGER